ncbi:hypothetical protein [Pseudomonas sp. P867]|uniref:hypothetical protein n=1 Tax=Pseudomonas sp. P867 TaxID=2816050 RepID=UPI00223C1058|nr:hypothetical protein [Pseudomonas sp. P867]
MSTFAVFGMILDVAKTEAREKTAGTRKNPKAPAASSRSLRPNGWSWSPSAPRRSWGTIRQLSPLFDAPQYAEQFIELARKTLRCRDMRIRAKAVLVGAKGKPIINPKTKAPTVGFTEWPPKLDSQAA